jgi:hypothetical protein
MGEFSSELDAFISPLVSNTCLSLQFFFRINGCPEPTRPLLIHFCPRCHSVDSQIKSIRWLNNVYHFVRVLENEVEHLSLRLGLRLVYWMAARMNDAVHIQIEVFNQWVILRNPLLYECFFQAFISQGNLVWITTRHALLLLKLSLEPLNIIFLQGIDDHLWVPYGQPPEECWHSHFNLLLIIG